MPLFEIHVFVCTNVRPDGHPRGSCHAKGAEAIREALRAEAGRRGLGKRVRTNASGCLDRCRHGITVVVYPGQVWYGFVTPEDVSEIVESHLVKGCPVERLRLPDGCINTSRCAHNGGGS